MSAFEPTNQGLLTQEQGSVLTVERRERDLQILFRPQLYSPEDYLATLLRVESDNSQAFAPLNLASRFLDRNLQAHGVDEVSPGRYRLAA